MKLHKRSVYIFCQMHRERLLHMKVKDVTSMPINQPDPQNICVKYVYLCHLSHTICLQASTSATVSFRILPIYFITHAFISFLTIKIDFESTCIYFISGSQDYIFSYNWRQWRWRYEEKYRDHDDHNIRLSEELAKELAMMLESQCYNSKILIC